MFESYLAPAAGVAPDRDLACAEIWEISLNRSRRRRDLAGKHRKAAPKTKGAAAAVSAALLVSPMLSASAATARSVSSTSSAAQERLPRTRHADGSIVKRGDTGGTVAKVQRALAIEDDGIFGPLTARAVRTFQRTAGLAPTGKVDRGTWRVLFASPVSAVGSGAADPTPSGGAAPATGAPGAPGTANPAPPANPAPAAGACAPTTLAAPLEGTKTSGFGDGRDHAGIDLSAPVGTAVRAAACGTVEQAGSESGYGTIVCMRHTTAFVTCYAHLSSMRVSKGMVVKQGQLIGRVGMTGRSTGPHLHFETRVDGTARDPEPYLGGSRAVPGTPVAAASGAAR